MRQFHSGRPMRRMIAAICALVALAGMAGCSGNDKAVGDTQAGATASPRDHDSVQGATMTVGIVGSARPSADEVVLDAYGRDGMQAFYASTEGTKDPDQTARDAVADYVKRRVLSIMICDIDVTAGNADAWKATLGAARKAGIPVILLNPVNPPEDEALYAATFIINDRMRDAEAIAEATETIIRDEPHERDIMVSLNTPADSVR